MNLDSSFMTACYVPLVPINVEAVSNRIFNSAMSNNTGKGRSCQPEPEGTVKGSPCLLCGAVDHDDDGRQLSLDDTVVKHEVSATTANDSEERDACSHNDVFPQNNEKRQNANQSPKWTQDEKTIYQCFLKWFKLKLTSETKKGKRVNNLGWDSDSGEDPFPFCTMCKSQLWRLVEFENTLVELEQKIKDGVEMLKRKANECEDAFGRNGIYEKDQRYHRVRKQIVADYRKRYPSKIGRPPRTRLPDPLASIPKTRKSSRGQAKATPHVDSLNSLPYSEVVLLPLPTTDTEIKKEVVTEDELNDLIAEVETNFEDEGEMDFISDHNSEDDSDSSQPVTRRRKSTRKRKSVSKNEDNFVSFDESYDDHDEELQHDEDDADLSPKTSFRRFPPPKPQSKKGRKRSKKELRDEEEWTLNEAKDAEAASDEDDEKGVLRLLDAGMRAKVIFDTEKKTVTYKNIVLHQQEPYSDNKYECSECGMVVVAKASLLRSHYLRKHSDLYACKKCSYRANGKSSLNMHVKTVHEGVPHARPRVLECPVCLRPSSKGRLKAHLWTHKSQEEKNEAIARGDDTVPQAVTGNHQCEECGRSFTLVTRLKQHKLTVHLSEEERQSKMELCPMCGGTFLYLKLHQREVHGVDAKEFKCLEPGCGKVFPKLSRLTKHKDSVHRQIREYKCSLCPRTFNNPKNLQKHVDGHNGLRPFQCTFCPNAFIYKSNWQRHIQSFHTEGRVAKRKSFVRGPAMLPSDVRKRDLIKEGKYLPPSALATWAAGREPTSHFPVGDVKANATSFLNT